MRRAPSRDPVFRSSAWALRLTRLNSAGAAIVLEWIRPSDGPFEREPRDYVFTDKPLTHD